jgi:hypothetical protein
MLFDDSNWNFDNVHHFITPNAEVNPNTTANEVDSDDESEKMSSVGSCYISSDESQCTNDETVSDGTRKHNGNIIINLPNLNHAIQVIACCKFCARSNTISAIDNFVTFCANEQKKNRDVCKSLPMGEGLEMLRSKMDVNVIYQMWKQKQCNIGRTIPLYVTTPTTVGLATRFQFCCSRCECLGDNDG